MPLGRRAERQADLSETQSFGTAGVVAPHPAAAVAARDVLIEGGNAIEAAVAAAAVASVVLQDRAGLGGDGLWLIREPGAKGRTRVIDARGPAGEAASLRSYRDRELEAIPRHGADAVLTVPGAPGGWHAALDFSNAIGGRLPLRRLLEPAVQCARTGFVTPDRPGSVDLSGLADVPGFAAAFLTEGKLAPVGTARVMPRLAETLGYLAHSGLEDFYRGDVGRESAADLERLGIPLSRADFRRFEARWRAPGELRIARRRIEAPPTGRALPMLLALGLHERLGATRPQSADALHNLLETFSRARALTVEGAETDGDPAELLSDALFIAEAERVDAHRAPLPLAAGPEGETFAEDGIWIGIIDRDGLAVSLVQSLGTTFGSGLVLPGTELLLGNRGAAFALSRDAGPVLRSGRRAPMGSLPALVVHDDGRVGAFGAVGAGGAILAADVSIRLQSGVGLADAIAAPRLLLGRDPDGDPIWLAEPTLDPSLIAALVRTGHRLIEGSSDGFGEAGALLRHPKGRIEAAADPRRTAAVEGF